MCDYIGITIGPIYDTLLEASTPASLWFASSLFSDITRRLCVEIRATFEDAEILSPYYSDTAKNDDGVGKYHDRIVFSTNRYDRYQLKKIIGKVKSETSLQFSEDIIGEGKESFFQQYLQIHFAVLSSEEISGKNCILALSPYLDTLELMKTFPKDNFGNPIKQLFMGEKEGRNIYIKSSQLFMNVAKNGNQLIKRGESIWSIDEIAASHMSVVGDYKKYKYYAVVQADGDSMSTFLSNLENTKVTEFSKILLKYAETVSVKIGAYKGMTVYAGGDDLLFLAPLENDAGKTIFQLCREIGVFFREQMENAFPEREGKLPTLSFGISVQYIKYPLYEAMGTARELLNLAKYGSPTKNKTAIEVQKHSGRSIRLVVSNENYIEFEKFIKSEVRLNENEETITAVIHTIEKFKQMISVLNRQMEQDVLTEKQYEMIWMNFFDNPEQKVSEDYIRDICNTYYHVLLKKQVEIIIPQQECYESEQEMGTDSSLQVLLHLLWLKKFLTERGEEQ